AIVEGTALLNLEPPTISPLLGEAPLTVHVQSACNDSFLVYTTNPAARDPACDFLGEQYAQEVYNTRDAVLSPTNEVEVVMQSAGTLRATACMEDVQVVLTDSSQLAPGSAQITGTYLVVTDALDATERVLPGASNAVWLALLESGEASRAMLGCSRRWALAPLGSSVRPVSLLPLGLSAAVSPAPLGPSVRPSGASRLLASVQPFQLFLVDELQAQGVNVDAADVTVYEAQAPPPPQMRRQLRRTQGGDRSGAAGTAELRGGAALRRPRAVSSGPTPEPAQPGPDMFPMADLKPPPFGHRTCSLLGTELHLVNPAASAAPPEPCRERRPS
ncbi:hypothetical protein CYMTET_23675, partial [Cymbomonas tetramitiformis]